MTGYCAIYRDAWDAEASLEDRHPRTLTVMVQDEDPVWTGLYDKDGNKLYRTQDKVPIGFHAR